MIPYFNRLLDILFPPVCFACGEALSGAGAVIVCAKCSDSISRNIRFAKKDNYILLSSSHYSERALRSLIWQLKFRRRTSAAPELAKLLYNMIISAKVPVAQFMLVPIPLHVSRMRERGFNQTELIAQELAKLSGAQVDVESLCRVRKTKHQAEIKSHCQREENLKNSFAVLHPENISGKNIILIDDVWTSGATMNEATRVLKLAGACKIIGLVVAKA